MALKCLGYIPTPLPHILQVTRMLTLITLHARFADWNRGNTNTHTKETGGTQALKRGSEIQGKTRFQMRAMTDTL